MDRTLVELAVYLARREATSLQIGTSDQVLRDTIAEKMVPIQAEVIPYTVKRSPERGDLYGNSQTWLFLPAPRNGPLRIPVLNILWYWDREPKRVSYQLAVFYRLEGRDPLARAWRFESPEGEGSTHGFFHAQPGNTLRTAIGEIAIEVADPEIPQGAPTLPLDADGHVELFVTMLVALYGLHEANEIVEDAGDPEVGECMRTMRSIASG